MAGDYPGEFEVMVLVAILRLGDDAYGWTVARELERVAGRSVSSGALYTTLNRLEQKGLIRTRAGESTEERGGRPRRYLAVTASGAEALARAREAMDRLWAGVDVRLGDVR
jgi:PadR family transcriptional regulator, regulatory protein PadR